MSARSSHMTRDSWVPSMRATSYFPVPIPPLYSLIWLAYVCYSEDKIETFSISLSTYTFPSTILYSLVNEVPVSLHAVQLSSCCHSWLLLSLCHNLLYFCLTLKCCKFSTFKSKHSKAQWKRRNSNLIPLLDSFSRSMLPLLLLDIWYFGFISHFWSDPCSWHLIN